MSLSNRPSHDSVLLYAHPSMHKLAKQIAECCWLVGRMSSSDSSASSHSSSSSSCNLQLDDYLQAGDEGKKNRNLCPDDSSTNSNSTSLETTIIRETLLTLGMETLYCSHPDVTLLNPITKLENKATSSEDLIPAKKSSSVLRDTASDCKEASSCDENHPILQDITGYEHDSLNDARTDCQPAKPAIIGVTKGPSQINLQNNALIDGRGTKAASDATDPRPARKVEFRNTIQWNKFADGYPNLFIEDVKYVAGKDVIFIGSFHSTEIIFEQLSVLYAFPRYLARSFHFILPYFPTGTMERVDTEGQIATAKTLATLLSSIPLSAQGPAQIIIYDIHALQERFYFSDNVIPRLETAIPLLQRVLNVHPHRDSLAVAFPDDGAYKRFHSYFPDDDCLIICAKKRVEGNKRVVTIKDGNPRGKHVVIIDDLVQSGGTLIECAKVLVKQGAKSVSAYVTHPVFPNHSWKNFLHSDPPFANFWITNSIPHAEEICKHRPFRLLSLSDIIAENLLGFDLRPY